jgi:hypothetical protein
MNRRKKILAGGAILATVALAGGAAFAAWSSDGGGSGRARSIEAVDAVINPANGTADLYPGFDEGDVYFTIDNPNDYPITYTTMTAADVTSSDETACAASNVTVDGATDLALVAPPGTSTQLSIADVVSMDLAAGDGCQNQSFDVELTLTGAQSG